MSASSFPTPRTDLFDYPKYWAECFGVAPFLPMSRAEMDTLGWDSCDIIIVTGDAYVDHPSFGMAIVGRLLEDQGFRVGIIAQPDWQSADAFKTLGDSRRGHGLRHRQSFVLACAAMAMLMGAGSYQAFEDVCGKFTQRQLKALGCRFNAKKKAWLPPSDSTFFRVLNKLDAGAFDRVVGQWMMQQDISVLQALAVDGKVLRGSGRGDGKPLQLLSAVSHRLRLTVAQEPIEEKSNEIPAIKPLLGKVPCQGTLITADAMHCQQETARFITQELGGDYIFGLKGNQSGILERAQIKLPQDFFSPSIRFRLGE